MQVTEDEKASYRSEIQQEPRYDNRLKKWGAKVWPLLNSPFTIFLLGTVVLGLFTRQLDEQRRDEDLRIALENQRTTLLEKYFDATESQIGKLFVPDPGDKEFEIVRASIRGRTLAVLPNLDAVRKGLVIDYLYGSDVLLRVDALLYGADLRAADLNGRFLSEADLSGANLREANLSGADLSKTDLSGANLGGADLSFANLFEAGIDDKTQIDPKWKLVRDIVTDGAEGRTDLSKADLSRANLSFVNLRGADLREVNLKEANLREAKYDNDTDWPDGFDPKAAGAILVE